MEIIQNKRISDFLDQGLQNLVIHPTLIAFDKVLNLKNFNSFRDNIHSFGDTEMKYLANLYSNQPQSLNKPQLLVGLNLEREYRLFKVQYLPNQNNR